MEKFDNTTIDSAFNKKIQANFESLGIDRVNKMLEAPIKSIEGLVDSISKIRKKV